MPRCVPLHIHTDPCSSAFSSGVDQRDWTIYRFPHPQYVFLQTHRSTVLWHPHHFTQLLRTQNHGPPRPSNLRQSSFIPPPGQRNATADTPVGAEAEPIVPEVGIRWILQEVRLYLSPDIKVRHGVSLHVDILSA